MWWRVDVTGRSMLGRGGAVRSREGSGSHRLWRLFSNNWYGSSWGNEGVLGVLGSDIRTASSLEGQGHKTVHDET